MLVSLLAALASAAEPAPTGPGEPSTAAPSAAPDAPSSAAPAPVAAPTVALFPLRAVNLGAAESRAAEVYFRRRYELAAGGPVLPEETVRAAVTTADDAGLAAACLQLTCARWITLDLVRLDKEIFVVAVERDAAGVVLARAELEAPSLDFLGRTLDRVARALVARVPAASVPIDNSLALPPSAAVATASAPTAPSTRPPRRLPNPDSLGFRTGIHGPLWPNFQLATSVALTYRQEVKGNFFEGNIGFTLPLGLSDERSWGMLFAEVGLFHLLGETEKFAFYAGGGLGPRIGGYDDIGIGVGVYGAAGAAFGDRGRAHVYTQLKLGGDVFTSLYAPYAASYAGIEAGVGF